MPKYLPALTVLMSCLLGPKFALAQAPALVTDRPDFTESPFVVPLGSIQLESGVTRVMDGPLRSTSGPELLVRWSPASRLELRLEPPGLVHVDSTGAVSDFAIGTKVEVGQVGGWTVGAIASLAFPTGDSRVSAGRVVPEIIIASGRDLGDRWSLGAQTSVARPQAGGGVAFAYTLVTGRALSDRLGVFLELATAHEPTATMASLLHTGLALSLSPTVQLDVHGARRLTGPAPSSSFGFGVSTRVH